MNPEQVPSGGQATPFKCKFCGKDGLSYALPGRHGEEICDTGIFAASKLRAMLTHDWCHTLFYRRKDAIEKVVKAASAWYSATAGNRSVKPEARAATEKVIESGTRDLAAAISDRYCSQIVHWDPEVVEQILSKPRLVFTVLGVFERYCKQKYQEKTTP